MTYEELLLYFSIKTLKYSWASFVIKLNLVYIIINKKHLKMEIFNIIVLLISGLLVFTFAGVLRLINPIKNYLKNTGIKLENEVNLLSEARGMSSVMMFGGIIIVSGIFIPKMTIISFAVAILLFLGYAFGRSLSIVLDGKPNKLIIQGVISEFVLGALNVFCLVNALV